MQYDDLHLPTKRSRKNKHYDHKRYHDPEEEDVNEIEPIDEKEALTECDNIIHRGGTILHMLDTPHLKYFVFKHLREMERYIQLEKKRASMEPYDPLTFETIGPFVGRGSGAPDALVPANPAHPDARSSARSDGQE